MQKPKALREVPRAQRRALAKPLVTFEHEYVDRREAMARSVPEIGACPRSVPGLTCNILIKLTNVVMDEALATHLGEHADTEEIAQALGQKIDSGLEEISRQDAKTPRTERRHIPQRCHTKKQRLINIETADYADGAD